ncbi:MAG TPA: M50 family metallopeptidase [Candidatus Saccharimonadales bacterium]|nr:M50 family metallopeptidase [Candidatus Saccharimonadales bacterium]
MSVVIPLLLGIFILGFLVLIHEAGHFLTARAFGVRVLEFGIGFPFLGRIFKFKRKGTVYSVNWLLFGGFVQLYGEEAGSSKDPDSFASKNVWVRFTIAAAGIVVNIVFAILLFTILMATSHYKVDFPNTIPNKFPLGNTREYVMIVNVDKDSPASFAGLKLGDKIQTMNGQKFTDIKEVQSYVLSHKGQPITLVVENSTSQTTREAIVVPRVNPPAGKGSLGVSLDSGQTLSYDTPFDRVFVGVEHSINMVEYQVAGLKTFISKSVAEKSIEPLASQASGPVRIIAVLGFLVQNSGSELLRVIATFTALISLMLGIGNLLPIPALDGGRLAFFLIEGLTGHKVKPRVENLIHGIGFVVLLFLLVLITANDIFRVFTGHIFG